MMGYWIGNPGWPGMILNWVIWVGLIVGLAILLEWIFGRWNRNHPEYSQNPVTQTANEIARERYAKGEISREEFLALISDLETR